MSKKIVVLTMYGKSNQVHDISVTLFDESSDYRGDQNAISYCQNHNLLKLENDDWMYSKIIEQNKKVRIEIPVSIEFDIIKKFGRDDMEHLCHELGYSDIAVALQDGVINETYVGKILNEPPEARPYRLNSLIEEYEKHTTVSALHIQESREKVVEAIKKLVIAGKIDIDAKTEGEKHGTN